MASGTRCCGSSTWPRSDPFRPSTPPGHSPTGGSRPRTRQSRRVPALTRLLTVSMDRPQLTEWIADYERAWRSPGTQALAELFTENAIYSTAPYENPHRGLQAIAE